MTIAIFRTVRVAAGAALSSMLLAASAHASLTIATDATQNVTCSAGVCSATAADAVLNVTDLTNMLASSPLTIQSGSLAQDITVNAPFSWTSANALTLDSFDAITVNQSVSDAGPAALTIITNDGGAGGTLFFGTAGRISFLSTASALTINGQIYKLEANLKSLAFDIARKPAGSFALANAYDASADGLYLLSPVTTTLRGNFTGLGNTISKLTIADGGASENVGLFAVLDRKAHVSGVRLKGEVVRGPGSQSNVGGLAGVNEATIDNVNIDGKVTGTIGGAGSVGLLSGRSDGRISNSSTSGAVHGYLSGGVVGSGGGAILASHSSAKIVGVVAGGLIGGGDDGATVSLSSASGDISGSGLIGGLVGECANIDKSFATGNLASSGNQPYPIFAGGVFGDGCAGETAIVNDSYATGSVLINTNATYTNHAGGFAGNNRVQLKTSYSIGAVVKRKNIIIGGSIALMDSGRGGTAEEVYWDTDTARARKGVGSGPDTGVTGLTDAELKSGLPAGFDPNVWAEDPNINNGYPYLIANPPGK